jgi:hypothetical protein
MGIEDQEAERGTGKGHGMTQQRHKKTSNFFYFHNNFFPFPAVLYPVYSGA